MTLRRGFKAEAEREAARVRKELGLSPHDRLDPRDLASHLSVLIVDAAELVDIAELEELERLQAFAFSAATFDIEDRKIIVVSPLRNSGRQNSDIAHELAHLMLKHDLSEIREVDGMPFRTCKPDEEEEATAFGGTLLLPRPLAAERDEARGQCRPDRDSVRRHRRWRGSGTTRPELPSRPSGGD